MPEAQEKLNSLTSEERLAAYQTIIDGCNHAWSKNKPQVEKIKSVLNILAPLAEKDPYFLAHLTSYIMQRSQAKDLRVFLAYISSLSSADGMPFSEGSKYKKPNLRYLSAAAVQMLEPKLAERVLYLASQKYEVPGQLNFSRHFPNVLRSALKKYVQYREQNPEILRGIKKAGLSNVLQNMYRGLHLSPSDEAAAIMRWQQKDHTVVLENSLTKEFAKLDDLGVAEKIRTEKLPVLGVLGALPRKISPVIAVALLEQATGNQAVILRKTFEDAGVLEDPEVMELYKNKIATAQTALDRVETLTKDASEAVKKVLVEARSEQRKSTTSGLGKIFLHVDISPSMANVLKFAMERGAIFAECVDNPRENFKWGLFDGLGQELPLPDEFVQDAFKAVLFGRQGLRGGTDAFALYPIARQFGADVDVFVSDQEHNYGSLTQKIADYHRDNPDVPKPKACVIVDFNIGRHGSIWSLQELIQTGYENNNIPVAVMKPETLTQSALVSEAVRSAMLGPVAQVDEIMDTPLLKLPEWYYTL